MIKSSNKENINDIEYFQNLVDEIKSNLKEIKKPLIIEFSGLPKSGKTTIINSLYIFLKRNNIKTVILKEEASNCPIKAKDNHFFNVWTSTRTLSKIIENIECCEQEVILIDRGLFDALVWFSWQRNNNNLNDAEYNIIKKFLLLKNWFKYISMIMFIDTKVETALQREYNNLITSKHGTIMNKNVLTEYQQAAYKLIDNLEKKIKIIKVDTTENETIENVMNISKIVLNNLRELSDEELIAINKDEFIRYDFVGFRADKNNLKIIENLLVNNSTINNRSKIEHDNSLIQVIVIGIVEYKDSLMTVVKYEANEESRFHEKRLLWVGGHYRNQDYTENTNTKSFLNCLKREVNEELFINNYKEPDFVGIVYDNTNTRSTQHLGIIYKIEIEDENIFRELNGQTISENTKQKHYISFIKKDEFSDETKYEKLSITDQWSINILRHYYNFDIKIKDNIQMYLF